MNKREIVLDSGVKLLMINTKKFKTTNITLFFEDELNDFNVTCDNLLIKLLTTKTNIHPSRKEFKSYLKDLYDMKISGFKDALGETFSFYLNVDSLNKKFTLNNENLLEKQFELLNEVLYNPLVNDVGFVEEYFKEIKTEYKQKLISNENYKEYIVNKKVNKILGEDNKLFVLSSGYIEKLENISNNDVYKKYLNLNSLCKKIVVCGEIDFDEVIEYANKYLKFNSNRSSFNHIFNHLAKKYDDVSYDSKFSQSAIGILYDLDIYIGDPLYYNAVLFIEMFNYYLFKIVREEYNFCYSIYTGYFSSRGLCYLQSNIDSKNYEMTLKLVNDILNDLQTKIDDNVLNICKDKVISGFKKEIDNPFKISVNEYRKDIYNLKETQEIVEICKNITPEEVKDVASRMKKKFSIILKEGN